MPQLRPAYLSTTHRKEIVEHDEIALPVGKAKTSFIDARDLGAVAAKALTESDHVNKKYTLTGNEALDYFEVVASMSEVLGRPVRYTNPSAIKFFRQQIAGGSKLGYALVVTGLYTITRFGNAAEATPDVATILGRPPITLHQFVEDHSPVWQP